MILSQVSAYLNERGQASSIDIALHFNVAPDALKGMLALLQAKGRVRPLPAELPSCGGSCHGCGEEKCGPQIWQALPRV